MYYKYTHIYDKKWSRYTKNVGHRQRDASSV